MVNLGFLGDIVICSFMQILFFIWYGFFVLRF